MTHKIQLSSRCVEKNWIGDRDESNTTKKVDSA